MDKYQSISVTNDYFKKIDLSARKEEIFQTLKKIPSLHFSQKCLWESRYWGKGVGAFQIEGSFKMKNNQSVSVIIKIQGAKPLISEAKILEKLQLIKDKKIHFPSVIFHHPWSYKQQYEIIIFAKINADFIIIPHRLAKLDEVEEFFNAYKLYKNFSKKISPFIKKPKKPIDFFEQFLKWRKIREENPLKLLISNKEDKFFLSIAKRLGLFFKKTPLVFQHNHLSIYDIKKKNNDYYLFSNLFWGYRWPYYDAVFGFMWYLLGLSNYKESQILNQIKIWEEKLFNLNSHDYDKINLALIERYLAALNLDMLMINKKEEIIKIKGILLNQIKKNLKVQK